MKHKESMVINVEQYTETCHLIENISSPFSKHQHYHQWQTKADVARSFNQDYCQAQSHANYPTYKT